MSSLQTLQPLQPLLQHRLNQAVEEGSNPQLISSIYHKARQQGVHLNSTIAAVNAFHQGKFDGMKKFLLQTPNSDAILNILTLALNSQVRGSRYIFEDLARTFPNYLTELLERNLHRYNTSYLQNRLNYLLGRPEINFRDILTRAVLENNGDVIQMILQREVVDEEIIAQLLVRAVTRCEFKVVRAILEFYHASPENLRDFLDYLNHQPESKECEKTRQILQDSVSEIINYWSRIGQPE